jgi:cytoskeleton protein RodZ
LAALALLLGLGVWLFYQHYVAKPSPTQPSASANGVGENVAGETTGAPVEAVLPEAALPAAERAPEPAATDMQTSTALTLPANSSTSPATNPAPPPAPAAALPAPAVAPTAPLANVQLPNSQLTASTTLSAPLNSASADLVEPLPAPVPKGVAKLEFNATQETWVNVLDVNGREVYSKIIFAGSRESINVKPPVNVTVGNAGGTSMSMNGKPVELAPHSRNNVAHVKLNN